MDHDSTVLIASEVPKQYGRIAAALSEDYDYRVLFATSAAETQDILEDANVDLVIGDAEARGFDATELLGNLRVSQPSIVRLLVLGGRRPRSLGEVLSRTAAYQYLVKPLAIEQVCLVVKRSLETRELARRHRLLSRELKIDEDAPLFEGKSTPPSRETGFRFEKLVYASEPMAELCNLARQAAKTELPILIQGETGTGKELLARAIHFNSNRSGSPLMVQNCGGVPDELLHSELFGHKRGAFTGAISDRLGLFRAADGGTVFLDEISDVSPTFQVNLLRFLQEGEVKPLGSDRMDICDVRIIAASNRPLRKLVERGEFREDLYFRLQGFDLMVPPLRERPADIPVLAEFFVQKHRDALGRRVLGIANEVVRILMAYPFPGNVRELENEIRRMVALAQDGEYLTTRHLPPSLANVPPVAQSDPSVVLRPEGSTLKEMVESLEVQLVKHALDNHRWNQSKAARQLGLSRVGLANKIKRYALSE
jgi:two-component system response regulator HupR/HoxA